MRNSLKSNSSQLGSYVAGLWEGDGHLWIPKTSRAPSGKLYYPHFSITFHEWDYPLIVTLKELIGGTIRHKKDNNAYVLTISSLSGVKIIIPLLNGKLRTPKIIKFNSMIDWINSYTGSNFSKYTEDTSPLLENAWFSGFIDADGSFDLRITLKSQKYPKNSVSARFRIEQRVSDPVCASEGESYLNIFQIISNVLGVRLGTTIHNNDIEYLIISLSSLKSRIILIEYLDHFPLFSSKFLNYTDWKKCHTLMIDKVHLTEEGRNKAIYLKSSMNRNRNHFNWDHLNKLSSY